MIVPMEGVTNVDDALTCKGAFNRYTKTCDCIPVIFSPCRVRVWMDSVL